MKRYLLSLALIITFIVYVWHGRTDDSSSVGVKTVTPIATTPVATDVPSQVSTSDPNSTSVPSSTTTPSVTTGKYKDGTYTGNVVDAFYGNVQVRAVIGNGQITDVQFLQYPNDRGHSIELSNQATPILRTEAIQSQTADVDIVSGATQTSDAFKKSLASALIKAQ